MIFFMADTVSRTAFPPSSASVDDFWAISSVLFEFTAFWLTVVAISSREEAISSTPAAWDWAPSEIMLTVWAISSADEESSDMCSLTDSRSEFVLS